MYFQKSWSFRMFVLSCVRMWNEGSCLWRHGLDMHILDSAEGLLEHGGIPSHARWAIDTFYVAEPCYVARLLQGSRNASLICNSIKRVPSTQMQLRNQRGVPADVCPADDISARGDADAFACASSQAVQQYQRCPSWQVSLGALGSHTQA